MARTVGGTVLRKLVERRTVAHLALAGLALAFAVLAVLGFLGNLTTTRTATQARETNEVSSAWSDLLVRVNAETEAVSEYVRLRNDDVAVLASVHGSAAPSLALLAARVTGRERQRVELVTAGYRTFGASVTRVLAAGRQGRTEQAMRQAEQALLGAAAMRKQITVGVQVARQQINQQLDLAVQESRRLRSIELALAPAVVALLFGCGLLILAYQRRVERHAANNLRQATHDALTGLANRVKLHAELDRAIQDAEDGGHLMGLLLIDLNGFKDVNDTLGHHHGDLLLQQVAERLRGSVRDDCLVARLGGDEFAVVIGHLDAVEDGVAVAERIRGAIDRAMDLDGVTVRVSGSIGLSVYSVTSGDAMELLRHADAAMYHAKRHRMGVTTYSHELAPPQAA